MTTAVAGRARGERPTRDAVESLNRAISQANTCRFIDTETLVWTWLASESTVDAFAPVTLDAADLLTADNHDRLRTCPSCEWLFEDRTRNAQRRWCDMADCGSRDKARRYYQRSIQR